MTEINFAIKTWRIEALTGYKPITTYFEDFSIAEPFGLPAIKATYRRNFGQAKKLGYKYVTEFVMALNWKGMQFWETNEALSRWYYGLYEQANDWAWEHLKGEALEYFMRTTD